MRSHVTVTRRNVLGLLTGSGLTVAGGLGFPGSAAARQVRDWRPVAADVRNELRHAWNAYRRYAWGHDHLLPVSRGHSEFFDPGHPTGLTIVEALDTLYLMGLDAELAEGIAWVRRNFDFRAVNADVQVFETNIRVVGGLLSGYLATGEAVLLRQARTVADILMPCFENSPTGIPYRFVNPSTGTISGTTNLLAEIGTIITEFGTLSRLVGDPRYYRAAKQAMRAVIDRRSSLGLLGTSINVETGAWIDQTSSIHPPVDSFYEYVWDAWDLFADTDFRRWYGVLTPAILRHQAATINGRLWFTRVDKDTGSRVSRIQSELGAFYAGLLGQSGHLRLGDRYLNSWTSVLSRYRLLPEGYDPKTGDAPDRGNQLRPEYVDSCFNLWLLTRAEKYRELAYDYYLRQKRHSRVQAGWTIAEDVTTDPIMLGDLTPGYWWSEQMKYWYLMFGQVRRFNYARNHLSTEGNVLRGLRRF